MAILRFRPVLGRGWTRLGPRAQRTPNPVKWPYLGPDGEFWGDFFPPVKVFEGSESFGGGPDP
jgi:hypothetical protein